ncbi:MAG: (2Fe-2S)-binding protein [Dehalococcoidales bacterium]|nr:MAG: (2Fe-2S)-binding protein [Dehalococcoidales bacterium]
MVTLTIDGVEISVQDGTTILDAARNVSGVGKIPTLCHINSPALSDLKPVKSCRVCTVEQVRDGRSVFPLSCVTQVREGMVINTNSDVVKERRKDIIREHLTRCSKEPVILELAKEMGVAIPEGDLQEEECILCGMCYRACNDPRGLAAEAISQVKQNGASYYQVDETKCLACGDCMIACSLGTVKLGEKAAIIPKPKAAAK